MKKLIILGLLALTACNDGHVTSIPSAPTTDKVIINDVPVPVLCKAEVNKIQAEIDSAEKGQTLEQQNAMMRASLAQQKAYIKALEAGVVGCGGSIK